MSKAIAFLFVLAIVTTNTVAHAQSGCAYQREGFKTKLSDTRPAVWSNENGLTHSVTLSNGIQMEFSAIGCEHYGEGYHFLHIKNFPAYDDANFFSTVRQYIKLVPFKETANKQQLLIFTNELEVALKADKLSWQKSSSGNILQLDKTDYSFSIEITSTQLNLDYQGYY
ncbi:MAG: hypothetical protein SFT92_04515 [Rickettsiales bacterium]|nr:hypothetical protein [Rickettsiales bacterium]